MAELRNLLKKQKCLVLPGTYNAFIARQIEAAGFPGVYISGAGLSCSLGVRDTGNLGLEDFCYLGRWITQAVRIPVICDADTGFKNIEETVKKYIDAGFSGMHIEDQVFPKRCGHLPGKEVIECKDMVVKIKRACAARNKRDPDFVIIARTDVRGAANVEEKFQLQESILRGNQYLEAGADMIFPDSLRNKKEFTMYRKEVSGLLLANMTEFGMTSFITTAEFAEIGYNMVLFPVSLFRYHAGMTPNLLTQLKENGNQKKIVEEMMNREEINKFLIDKS
jgi:methylisocitrate lyase